MTSKIQLLLDMSVLIFQELHEIVEDAKIDNDNPNAMRDTQELLRDWLAAYRAARLTEADRFKGYRELGSPAPQHQVIKPAESPAEDSATTTSSTPLPACRLTQDAMRNLAKCIEGMLHALTGEHLAFFITVFSTNPTEPRGHYISNADRRAIIPEIERLLADLKLPKNHRTLH